MKEDIMIKGWIVIPAMLAGLFFIAPTGLLAMCSETGHSDCQQQGKGEMPNHRHQNMGGHEGYGMRGQGMMGPGSFMFEEMEK